MAVARLYMERLADSERCFYDCELVVDLFGKLKLTRRWGRVYGAKQQRSECFPSIEQALFAIETVRRVSVLRGYIVEKRTVPSVPYVSLIPRRRYGYLSVKICELFKDSKILFKVGLKGAKYGVLYVGDLVQLSEREMAYLLYDERTSLMDLSRIAAKDLSQISRDLARFGLSLSARIPGWKRPLNYRDSFSTREGFLLY